MDKKVRYLMEFVCARPAEGWRLFPIDELAAQTRAAIVATMYVLFGLLTIPLTRDFFNLAAPPPPLLQVTMIASIGGCLAVEILGRIRARVNSLADARG